MIDPTTQAYYALTPDRVLDAVEVDGRRATGYVLSLNSLENRVYEVALEDDTRVVAKFYRPGRWSEAALRAEHEYLAELVALEIPAVAPLVLAGDTLRAIDVGGAKIWCAVFPKVRGRATDEPDDQQLEILGRLLARLHEVGAVHGTTVRQRLDVAHYGRASLEHSAAVMPAASRPAYLDTARRLLDVIAPLYERLAPDATHLRIHADCHAGNLLWDRSGPFFLDFDDFTLGPPVQDVWLLVPGRDIESVQRRDVMLDAYEELRPFDRRTLALIEPLRALRILRYSGWIAARHDDPAFQRAFPDFLDDAYWQRETATLRELIEEIR
ncbi:MAG: serine/threonine protein kinase [Polyangia bacterium]